jgi:hypothetical protein
MRTGKKLGQVVLHDNGERYICDWILDEHMTLVVTVVRGSRFGEKRVGGVTADSNLNQLALEAGTALISSTLSSDS